MRSFRLQRGLSQASLADQIATRGVSDPVFASLGLISAKTIANLERPRSRQDQFVAPRPQTVKILASALDLAPGSEAERTFYAAADETRDRMPIRARQKKTRQRPLFVRAGREDIIEKLGQAWQRARDGTPEFILLAGDAGLGKTLLIRELCMDIHDESKDARVAWGECSQGSPAVDPHLPVLQAMNMLLGLVLRDDDLAIPTPPILAQQVSTISTLLDVAPTAIGSLVDEQALTLQVEQLQDRHPALAESLQRAHRNRTPADTSGRLDQIVRFLATTAASAPVVLVLEDLHWAHSSVIALLQHLHRRLRDKTGISLLVIGSYRPSDLNPTIDAPRQPLEAAINEMARLGGDIVIDLGTTIGQGRGQAFTRSLAHRLHLDTGAEAALAEFLFERTEGHPLFAVELIDWLKAKGMLCNNEAHRLELALPTLHDDAPARIQAVITERMARLPQNLREILEGASVQGPTVAIDLIPNTSDFTGDQVAEAIEEQIAPRFRLLEAADPVLIATRRFHRYRFPHVFFQQYLYEGLTPSRRERLHARTAEKMIALLGDGPHSGAGDIAFHFSQAQRFDEAGTYSSHAGAYALRQLNFEMAEYWFEQAEMHALAVDDWWRVLSARNGRIGALRGQIHLDDAIRLARQVIAENRAHGFRDLEAESSYLLGQIYYDQGLTHEARVFLGTASSIYRELGKLAELSRSESMVSHVDYLLGAYDDALHHAYAAWESASTLSDVAFGAEGLLAAGNCEVDLGYYETAIDTYARGRAAYRRAHEIRGELYCNLNTGLCLLQLERYDEAIDLLQKVLRHAAALQAARIRTAACQYIGYALEGKDDPEAAMASFQEAYDIRRRTGQRGVLCDTIAAIIRVAIHRKDAPAIIERLKELERALSVQGGAGIEDPIQVWLTIADAYAELGAAADEASALRTGYALLVDRASRIASPDARHSYLSNVPANRTLRERYHDIVTQTDD